MPLETVQELQIGDVPATRLADDFGTPLYVYDAGEIRRSFRRIGHAIPYQPFSVHYACVTNSNVAIMRLMLDMGSGIHANTWGDAFMALKAGFPPEQIIYSGSNIGADDFHNLFEQKVAANLNSLSQLRQYAVELRRFEAQGGERLERLRRVGIRVHLEDKMPYSRMGVKVSEIEEA